MLKAENLKKRFGKREVLKGVSIKLGRGEIVGLLGPNGAGKTTTFRCLVGFEFPDEGKITLDGKDITKLPPYDRANLGIAFLPQEPSIFEDLTVFENVYMFAEVIYKGDIKKAFTVSLEILKDFNLFHLRNSLAGKLSGGERRRLEIARLFLKRPHYLFLDEPFAGVDPKRVIEIKKLILELKRKLEPYYKLGILITDHNVGETLKMVDRVYIIDEGQVLFSGLPTEAVKNKEVRERFLGHHFKLV
jgi:lipopolysaccharide export system ATP-binding protein